MSQFPSGLKEIPASFSPFSLKSRPYCTSLFSSRPHSKESRVYGKAAKEVIGRSSGPSTGSFIHFSLLFFISSLHLPPLDKHGLITVPALTHPHLHHLVNIDKEDLDLFPKPLRNTQSISSRLRSAEVFSPKLRRHLSVNVYTDKNTFKNVLLTLWSIF